MILSGFPYDTGSGLAEVLADGFPFRFQFLGLLVSATAGNADAFGFTLVSGRFPLRHAHSLRRP